MNNVRVIHCVCLLQELLTCIEEYNKKLGRDPLNTDQNYVSNRAVTVLRCSVIYYSGTSL